jgi:hypothetical protein
MQTMKKPVVCWSRMRTFSYTGVSYPPFVLYSNCFRGKRLDKQEQAHSKLAHLEKKGGESQTRFLLMSLNFN